jgi:enamine deaminase RidA (YjgF/YER057c/UK114 family)
VLGSVDGSVRFFGLTPTSMKLEGLDRHHRLIDSYKKLHAARAKQVNEVYAKLFPEGQRPARTVYQAAGLPYGGRVKVMGVAIKDS